MIHRLSLVDIAVAPDLQARTTLDPDRIAQYADDMQSGVEFPPLRVCRVSDRGDRHYLVSGFHRYHAAERAGREAVDCEVFAGPFAEARWDAAGSNREWDTAGARRTNADKRRAARLAWEARPDASQREIARQAGVTQQAVSKWINEWESHGDNSCHASGPADGLDRAEPGRDAAPGPDDFALLARAERLAAALLALSEGREGEPIGVEFAAEVAAREPIEGELHRLMREVCARGEARRAGGDRPGESGDPGARLRHLARRIGPLDRIVEAMREDRTIMLLRLERSLLDRLEWVRGMPPEYEPILAADREEMGAILEYTRRQLRREEHP
jgi:hypothetical protein